MPLDTPVSLRRRAEAGAFAVTLFAAAWLGMMAVHELGHVLHAIFSGGRVARVVLHPWPSPAPTFLKTRIR